MICLSSPRRTPALKFPPPPHHRDDLIDYADIAFQVLAAQISSNYLSFIKSKIIPELGEESEIPLRELRTLISIAQYDLPISGAFIARLLGYDPATVTRSTRWLLDQSFIYGENSESDARMIVFGLAPRGQRLSEVFRQTAIEAFREVDQVTDKHPSREEITQALLVFERLRDRSRQAAKLAKAHKRKTPR